MMALAAAGVTPALPKGAQLVTGRHGQWRNFRLHAAAISLIATGSLASEFADPIGAVSGGRESASSRMAERRGKTLVYLQ